MSEMKSYKNPRVQYALQECIELKAKQRERQHGALKAILSTLNDYLGGEDGEEFDLRCVAVISALRSALEYYRGQLIESMGFDMAAQLAILAEAEGLQAVAGIEMLIFRDLLDEALNKNGSERRKA